MQASILALFLLVAPSFSAGATQPLVVHLDHTSVRSGDPVDVTIENHGAAIHVSYAGGSSGCAIPRP